MKLAPCLGAAALAALTVSSLSFAAEPTHLICEGSDPAWKFELEGAQGRFTPPDAAQQELSGRLTTQDRLDFYFWRGRAAGSSGPELVVFIEERQCHDVEGEQPFSHTARLSMPSARVLAGCCRPAPVAGVSGLLTLDDPARVHTERGEGTEIRSSPEVLSYNATGRLEEGAAVLIKGWTERQGRRWFLVEGGDDEGLSGWVSGSALEPIEVESKVKAPDDWSRNVLDLVAAMRACIDQAKAGPALVTSALPMRMGMARVHVRESDGRRWRCLASITAGKVSRSDEMPEGLKLGGDGDPLFALAEAELPSGDCYEHEKVIDPLTSDVLGWLAYDTCGRAGVMESGEGR